MFGELGVRRANRAHRGKDRVVTRGNRTERATVNLWHEDVRVRRELDERRGPVRAPAQHLERPLDDPFCLSDDERVHEGRERHGIRERERPAREHER